MNYRLVQVQFEAGFNICIYIYMGVCAAIINA
jgi:hypothetical protein